MVHWLKRNSFILFFILSLPQLGYAQEDEFSFSQTSNTKVAVEYNENLAAALMSADDNALKTYLNQHPDAVNDASGFEIAEGKYVRTKKVFKPLIYHLYQLCLDGKKEVALFNWLINLKEVDVQRPFNEKPVFYHCLDYLATHKISECQIATQVFTSFIQSHRFNVWDKYGILYQPIIYVLRTNYDFLQGTYNSEYLDPSILEAFLNQGENINSYDQLGSNLLTYAVQTRRVNFQNVLQQKGIVIEKKNKLGQDAFYAAIASENIESIRSMVSAGYAISVEKLVEDRIETQLNLNNVELLDFLTQACLTKVSSSKQLLAFLQLFPNRKNQLPAWPTFNSITIEINDIPAFVNRLEDNRYPIQKDYVPFITGLKQKYILFSTDPETFCKAIQLFPIVSCSSCGTAYEVSESKSLAFQHEIAQLGSFTTEKFRQTLIQRIQQKSNAYLKTKLASAKTVEEYVRLQTNFPSQTGEIEQQCFFALCRQPSNATFIYSQDAREALSALNTRQTNMRDYLQHFNYRKEDVQSWLKSSPSFIDQYTVQINAAHRRERTLKNELSKILAQIEREEYTPTYTVKELDKHTLEIKMVVGTIDYEKTLNVNDKGEYYTGTIFTTDYSSISEFVWKSTYTFRSKWHELTEEHRNSSTDIQTIEHIIAHIQKNGIEKWYLSHEVKF